MALGSPQRDRGGEAAAAAAQAAADAAQADADAALADLRKSAKEWAVDGKILWAPPHAGDILVDGIVVYVAAGGSVTAGLLTLGKLVSGAYGVPVNQLAAASYNLAGLAANTPTSLLALLHATPANRTYATTALLQGETTGLVIADDSFVSFIPIFGRP
jgi:hypothetical protein